MKQRAQERKISTDKNEMFIIDTDELNNVYFNIDR